MNALTKAAVAASTEVDAIVLKLDAAAEAWDYRKAKHVLGAYDRQGATSLANHLRTLGSLDTEPTADDIAYLARELGHVATYWRNDGGLRAGAQAAGVYARTVRLLGVAR